MDQNRVDRAARLFLARPPELLPQARHWAGTPQRWSPTGSPSPGRSSAAVHR